MNILVNKIIEERFKSKKQQAYFFAKANDKSLSKKERATWAKRAKEFSDKTNFKKLPERAEEQIDATSPYSDETLEVNADSPFYNKKGNMTKSNIKNNVFDKKIKKGKKKEVDEIVDEDGNIKTGDETGNPNGYIRAKKTTDEFGLATMGQMGAYGIVAGASGANKTLRYWAESDMSKALGSDKLLADPKMDFNKATMYFEKDLDVPKDEAEERAEKDGFDEELQGTGKIRLIEDPRKYIEEYLSQRSKENDLVKKYEPEKNKKVINPIIQKQLKSIKQTLKNNNLSIGDIAEYLEDNE